MARERKAPAAYDPAAEAARPQWNHSAAPAEAANGGGGRAPATAVGGAARRERKATAAAFDPTLEAAKPQWNHVPLPAPSPHKRWPWLSNVVKAQRRPKARKRAPQSPCKAFAFDAEAATPSPHKRRKADSPSRHITEIPEAAAEAAAAGLFYMFAEPAQPVPVAFTAEANVLSYLESFRRTPEDEDEPETAPISSPSKKQPANGQNEEQIMRSLRHVVFAEVGTGHFKECCLGLREFIKTCSPRAFKGMKEDKLAYDLAPIVRHLQERWNSGALSCMPTPGHVALEVEDLADACKNAGFSRSLGFASKALNMLGLPVPPFSAVAFDALNLPKGLASYGRYLDAWTTKYAKVRREYEAAAAMHIQGVKQGKFIVIFKSYMERRLGSEWFGMRGFDVALRAKE